MPSCAASYYWMWPRKFRLCAFVYLRSYHGTYLQVAVLSAIPPMAVTLTLTEGGLGVPTSVHHMVAVADQRSGLVHSQIYSVSVPTPQADFAWRVTATLAKFGDKKEDLHTPLVGNQTVVVV